ncbi:glycosyltransferase family 2 protein [Paragemmobacter ruber]|uniref:Glycosyltransferase n=1 Tax=Paragemmobacter ruber TaxID=1985673 RepID=A0ABW9Y6I0_9RHOB|nr:glycosyltransferase family 2 protein [Rhodobacter ruber]NBE08124.1 glycosyltransferase [Rhodobacter ruber]
MFVRPPRPPGPPQTGRPAIDTPGLPSLAPFALTARAPRLVYPAGPQAPHAFPLLPIPGMAEAPALFEPAPARPARPAPTPLPTPIHAQPPRDLPHPIDLPLPVDPRHDPPDPHLLYRLGPAIALRRGLLPWRERGGETIILTASPAGFQRHAAFLRALYGARLRPLPCPRPLIEAALLAHAGPGLVQAAELRAPAIASCRTLDRTALTLVALLLCAALVCLIPAHPALIFGLFLAVTLGLCTSLTLLKIATAIAALRQLPAPGPPLDPADLPTISLLVPLYGEAEIAPRLIRRLSALDYPRDRLDVIVLLEMTDTATCAAIAGIDLPPWMRVIAVPDGRIRTKPRALNFGLDFTRGSLIGIYDAEDAPEPDQLLKVAAAFAMGPPRLGCVQGMLDFYNPHTNWIARCFTYEYAAWFRLFLPGLVRLGLPVPLGGTTLFLRRQAVLDVGGWDAHNVTEDADLGLRLARHGWQTDILASVTLEEANCRALPWVRQRSRWTKGYLMTWLVHMRAPRRLWRDLGPRQFVAMQVLILGALLQGIATPLLWSLWLVALGMPHPVLDVLDHATLAAMAPVMLAVHALDFILAAMAMRRAGRPVGWLWLPLLKPYALLNTFATAKAMVEAVIRPFHWDKTRHGHFDSAASPTDALPPAG